MKKHKFIIEKGVWRYAEKLGQTAYFANWQLQRKDMLGGGCGFDTIGESIKYLDDVQKSYNLQNNECEFVGYKEKTIQPNLFGDI